MTRNPASSPTAKPSKLPASQLPSRCGFRRHSRASPIKSSGLRPRSRQTCRKATDDPEETACTTGELPMLPRRKLTPTYGFSASQGPCIAITQLPPCSSSTRSARSPGASSIRKHYPRVHAGLWRHFGCAGLPRRARCIQAVEFTKQAAGVPSAWSRPPQSPPNDHAYGATLGRRWAPAEAQKAGVEGCRHNAAPALR